MRCALSIDTGIREMGYAIWAWDSWSALEPPLLAGVIHAGIMRTTWLDKIKYLCETMQEILINPFSVACSTYSVFDVERVNIEMPRMRSDAKGYAAGNATIWLGFSAGYLLGGLRELFGQQISIKSVYPEEWKGSLPKHVVKRRIELSIGDSDKSHNMFRSHAWDAVGIGLTAKGYPVKEMTVDAQH